MQNVNYANTETTGDGAEWMERFNTAYAELNEERLSELKKQEQRDLLKRQRRDCFKKGRRK